MDWNYGNIYEAIARAADPDRPALIHDGKVTTWKEYDKRTNNFARALLQHGLQTGDKVAFYMRNHAAYMETLGATFKARLTHVNINYRYVEDELWYIIDNSDSRVVVYGAEFAPQVQVLKNRLPQVVLWLQVDDGHPGAATDTQGFELYESLAGAGEGEPLVIERSGDDLFFLYTGGTTGMPKGVMWAHQDHWSAGGAGGNVALGIVPPVDLDEHIRRVIGEAGVRSMPVCPLMHGTGMFTAIGVLARAGCVVTTGSVHFDPAEVWQVVEEQQVNSLAIVGDAFARPMLQELEKNPRRYDITSLVGMISSGVMWSPEVKQGLLRHHAGMQLVDSFGASEAVGFGTSITTASGGAGVAKFTLGPNTRVFSEDHREIEPGSDEAGFVARAGGIPRGYYKDEEKTARTFPVINGVRYSIPGDWCRVESDGTLTLLGRGSVCINTAGEKVYPEEVEEVLKTHSDVVDALVVGLPDDKWGQSVTAVVEMKPGVELDEAGLRSYVRQSLAGYKCPKRILARHSIGRAVNGKADYKATTEFARNTLGLT